MKIPSDSKGMARPWNSRSMLRDQGWKVTVPMVVGGVEEVWDIVMWGFELKRVPLFWDMV